MRNNLKMWLLILGVFILESPSCHARPLINLTRNFLREEISLSGRSIRPQLAAWHLRFSSTSGASAPIIAPPSNQEERRTVRILSIGGGGIRGLIPLHILDFLERQVGKPISKQFDIIAGSSTGGIIALALNSENTEPQRGASPTERDSEPRERKGHNPNTAGEMIDIYINDCRTIFDGGHGSSHFTEYQQYYDLLSDIDKTKQISIAAVEEIQNFLTKGSVGFLARKFLFSRLRKFNTDINTILKQLDFFKGILGTPSPLLKQLENKKNLFNSSHSGEGLQKIRTRFGDKKLSESLSTVLVPAYNIGSDTPYLFNSVLAARDVAHDFKMGDVAMATSAAPTYFPPATIYNQEERKIPMPFHFVDGGVVANNPSLYALATAKNLFPKANDFYLLSLGCGTGPMYEIRKGAIGSGGVLSWSPFIITMLMNASNAYTGEVTNILMEEVKRMNPHNAPRSVYLSPRNLSEEIANNMDQTSEVDVQSIRTAAWAFLNDAATQHTLQGVIRELSAERSYATNGGVLDSRTDLQ